MIILLLARTAEQSERSLTPAEIAGIIVGTLAVAIFLTVVTVLLSIAVIYCW